MGDESTDISVTKELILYACILCGGKIIVHFLKIIKIPNGTADTIEKTIHTFLEKALIPPSHIASFDSDGADRVIITDPENGNRMADTNQP